VVHTLIARIVAASLVLSLFTACAGGGGARSGGNADPATPKNEPAELVVYSTSGDSEASWNERFGNALREKFPHYQIKYIPAQTGYGIPEILASGGTIDIYWDSIGKLANGLFAYDMQYDMTELIKKYKVDLNRFEPTIVEAIKQMSGGKMYGVPVFNNNMVLYYNKDLFDKFGVPYPKDGMTWDEATDLGTKLTRFDGGKQYVGLSSSGGHMLLMNQLSIPFIDAATEKATIYSNEKWKKYFETVFIAPARAPGYVDYMKAHNNGTPYRNEFLKDKDLAMFAWLTSIIFVFPDDFNNMNWDMVSLPTFKDLPGVGSQAYPTYFMITSISKHKDQAMEVIQYLTSDEMQMRLSKIGVMPAITNEAVKKAFGSESSFKGKNFAAAFYNKFAPIPPKTQYDSLLESPYTKAIASSILTGDMNTVFRTTEEDANKRIAEAKGK